jgi:OOP family OmpA-OmpF porin
MKSTQSRNAVIGSVVVLSLLASGAASAKSDDDEDEGDTPKVRAGVRRPSQPDEERPKEFRFDFGLVGGYHWFDSESGLGRYDTDDAELSPLHQYVLGARLGLHFNNYLTLEGEALWSPTRTRYELGFGGTKENIFMYRGSLLVHLAPPTWVVRPFLLGGFGGATLVPQDERVVFGDTDSAIHGGLGLKIAFGDYVGLRLEGRAYVPPAALSKSIAVGNETGYHGPDWEALGALYFNFGEVEVIEKLVVQEKRVVVEKKVPVANPDPDGDGIAGKVDKCPNVAEDKDGFEDEDGCPDDDNDDDKIPDVKDKCPDKAENVNGIDDDDGCPEVDSDGDGILGSRDKCPDEAETKNGYKDDDGCPDEIPQAVKKFTGVIEGIKFKSGRSQLLPGSYALLDRAVDVLKQYPEIRLEISGHTDSRGKADKNRDLSQARADAVKTYFMARGIDANRLTSIGYGSEKPVAENSTDSGRAQNRRTEFRLLPSEEGPGSKLEGGTK